MHFGLSNILATAEFHKVILTARGSLKTRPGIHTGYWILDSAATHARPAARQSASIKVWLRRLSPPFKLQVPGHGHRRRDGSPEKHGNAPGVEVASHKSGHRSSQMGCVGEPCLVKFSPQRCGSIDLEVGSSQRGPATRRSSGTRGKFNAPRGVPNDRRSFNAGQGWFPLISMRRLRLARTPPFLLQVEVLDGDTGQTSRWPRLQPAARSILL